MKKILFCILIPFLFDCHSYSQTDSAQGKWALGAFFQPDYSYRYLSGYDNSIQYLVDYLDSIEIGAFGFHYGINVSRRISEKLDFVSGVSYVKRHYRTKEMVVVMFAPDPAIPAKNGDHFYTGYITNYFQLPSGIRLALGKGKLKFNISAGVQFEIYAWENNYTYFVESDAFLKFEDSFQEFYLAIAPYAGAGMSYQISGKFSASFDSCFDFMLFSDRYQDASIRIHPWSLGSRFSFNFHL